MKKPNYLKPIKDNMPTELRGLDQWVCWKSELRDNRWNKVPYNAKKINNRAKVNDSTTWASFKIAWEAYEERGYDGVGFMLTENDEFVGIDIDHCIENGEIEKDLHELIRELNSYTEISPSGTGIRIFLKGKLQDGWSKKGQYEIYTKGRYLTLTGNAYFGECIDINYQAALLKDLRSKIEILEKDKAILANAFQSKNGKKIQDLFNGDWENHFQSHSEADASLCYFLANYSKGEKDTIDRIFRKSNLMRGKWDERHYSSGETYGEWLISNAVKNTSQGDEKNAPCGITALELIEMDIPPINWVVSELITQGLTLLGGKPKHGKSIMVLNIGLAVAYGGKAIGKLNVKKGGVIYYALEDNYRRLKERLTKMLKDSKPPTNLYFFTEVPKMGNGGLKFIEDQLQKYEDVSLVVIDTLAKFGSLSHRNAQNIYDKDYQAMSRIKDLADKHGIAILVVHHLRKSDAEDPMDTFSGTLGLTGAADSLMVLSRKSGAVLLQITGRDIAPKDYKLKFDPHCMSWILEGERENIKANNDHQQIFECIMKNGPIGPKAISNITELDYSYVRNVLSRYKDKWRLVLKGRGQYELPF